MKVLIDNGHGLETPGKRSPDGRLREYRYCREIAAEVVKALKVRGVDAELLTPEESDVSLAERCRRVNAHCAELGSANVCLVSIHNNAAGSGAQWMSARGWEAWTSRGQTRGDGLADCLYAAAAEVLQGMYPAGKIRKDFSDGDPDKESDFTILKRTNCAACLTENMFQDNLEDVEWLLSPGGREDLAAIHVEGVMAWMRTER